MQKFSNARDKGVAAMYPLRLSLSLFLLLLFASTAEANTAVYIWKDDPSYTRARIAEKCALWFAFGSLVLALVWACISRSRRVRMAMLMFVSLQTCTCVLSPVIFSIAGGGARFEGDPDWDGYGQVIGRIDENSRVVESREYREYREPGGRRLTLGEGIIQSMLLSGFICFGGLAFVRWWFGTEEEARARRPRKLDPESNPFAEGETPPESKPEP